MSEKRTTEIAETMFQIAINNMDRRTDRSSVEVQYALYMAVGLQSLCQAVREVYDRLAQLERKLATRS